jgi:signal transduction histidine kinase
MRRSPATIISFLSLLVLAVIQVYIVFSYYDVKSRNFDMAYSRAILSTIEKSGYNNDVDTLDFVFNRSAVSFIMGSPDTINLSYQNKIAATFDSLLNRYDENSLKVKKYLADNKLDTVFSPHYFIKAISFLVLNDKIQVYKNPENDASLQKSKGIYIKSYDKEGNFYAVQYDYYIDFTHKYKVIFTEIRGLLIMMILTIAAVILTFLYTLRTLRRQKKLSELKDDFIDNITHEFKTPLSIISVAVSSLKQQKIQDDKQKFIETCNALEKQNKFLSKMIDNVIDVSLLDRNTINYNKKPVPVKQLMNEITASFIANNEAVGKKVQIFEEYSISVDYEYMLDSVQFTRAINNLLSNAVKYCEREPVIRIRILTDNQLRIEIEDNGIGIKEEHLGNVFNKFYRADNPTNVKGLGLGLYIVKRIVENHNGSIHLESTWGKGTTVILTFPKLT